MKRCVCGSNWCEAVDLCSRSWGVSTEALNDLHTQSRARTDRGREREYMAYSQAYRIRRYAAQMADSVVTPTPVLDAWQRDANIWFGPATNGNVEAPR